MKTVAVILARAGSKGLRDKCVLPLLGRPVISYTIEHAQRCPAIQEIILTTDSEAAASIGRATGVCIVQRPAELATDTARVDASVRHAVETYEKQNGPVDAVVILYGNVPIRADGVIAKCVELLERSGGSSVRTVAPVTKQHPDWIHRLNGDRMEQFRPNSIHRRQELEPLYYHDGAVIAVTRQSLFSSAALGDDPHAFFGPDRRAVVQQPEDAVDIDTAIDLALAEAVLKHRINVDNRNLQIGQTVVGAGEPVYVVAEIGVNHDGQLSIAKELIHAAVDAKADAVKFQVFSPDRLVRSNAPMAAYQQRTVQADSQYEMLSRLALLYDDFVELAAYAKQYNIEFLATPFSVVDLQFLASLNVSAIKLSSTDIVNGPLLDAAAATGLPVIFSRGAAEFDEIAASIGRLRQGGCKSLALLHCVSSYPTLEHEANLAVIATLADAFDCVTGFSDHTESITIGGYAAAAGARIIEKHLTLDRSRPGPDHAFSLEPKQMAEYIRHIRQTEILLGHGRVTVSPSEQEVRTVSRTSIVAAKNIRAGDILTAEMLTVKRPGGGISPMSFKQLIGRKARTAIAVDTPITWEALV